jgi:integrase
MRFKEPKTHQSSRRIDLLPIAVDALRRHRAEQAKVRLALGEAWQDNDLVCSSLDGSPWKPDTMSSAFSKFIRRLDLPVVRFHDLRHTHATLLLREGVHPKIVSERLGHSGIGLTMDTYSHVLPGMQQEAAMKLNASLSEHLNRLHNHGDGQEMVKTGSDDVLPVKPSKSTSV